MGKHKNDCDLATCFLCRLCIKEWLPAIDAQRKNFYFKKGELLFREGDEVPGMYFIYSGTVKVHKQWGKEKELIVRFARKGRYCWPPGPGQGYDLSRIGHGARAGHRLLYRFGVLQHYPESKS